MGHDPDPPWKTLMRWLDRGQLQEIGEATYWKSMGVNEELAALLAKVRAGLAPDLRDAVDDYLTVRAAHVQSLRYAGHVSYETRETIEKCEKHLRAELHRHRRSNMDMVMVLRAETSLFRGLLAPEIPEAVVVELTRRTRGPDLAPRKRRKPATVAPPKKSAAARRADREAALDARVLGVLAGFADGLSMNKIEKVMGAKRAHVAGAIQRLRRAGKIRNAGKNKNDSRWILT